MVQRDSLSALRYLASVFAPAMYPVMDIKLRSDIDSQLELLYSLSSALHALAFGASLRIPDAVGSAGAQLRQVTAGLQALETLLAGQQPQPAPASKSPVPSDASVAAAGPNTSDETVPADRPAPSVPSAAQEALRVAPHFLNGTHRSIADVFGAIALLEVTLIKDLDLSKYPHTILWVDHVARSCGSAFAVLHREWGAMSAALPAWSSPFDASAWVDSQSQRYSCALLLRRHELLRFHVGECPTAEELASVAGIPEPSSAVPSLEPQDSLDDDDAVGLLDSDNPPANSAGASDDVMSSPSGVASVAGDGLSIDTVDLDKSSGGGASGSQSPGPADGPTKQHTSNAMHRSRSIRGAMLSVDQSHAIFMAGAMETLLQRADSRFMIDFGTPRTDSSSILCRSSLAHNLHIAER